MVQPGARVPHGSGGARAREDDQLRARGRRFGHGFRAEHHRRRHRGRAPDTAVHERQRRVADLLLVRGHHRQRRARRLPLARLCAAGRLLGLRRVHHDDVDGARGREDLGTQHHHEGSQGRSATRELRHL